MNIISEVQGHFHGALPPRIGVALSGGGDSMALLHILTQCFRGQGVEILAATVDHGLRENSADEAQHVAGLAAQMGINHEVLHWQGWQGDGNLQDQARQARYRLLTDWAKRNKVPVIALGHTADDQAETVLMRLARSAGVNGLAAMPVLRRLNDVSLLRPVLGLTRAQLRDHLRQHDLSWVEDPSNQNRRFERVRIRQAMKDLEPLGLTIESLSAVARNMAVARDALDKYALNSARDLAEVVSGAVVFDREKLRDLPDEIIHRLLLRALQWITGAGYPLRGRVMGDALGIVRNGGGLTLGGCRILCRSGRVWVCREYNAVRNEVTQVDAVWDRRWRITGGPEIDGGELRPLGKAGLMLCPKWRQTGCPSQVLESTPSIWVKNDLVAAPLAEMANGWTVNTVISAEEFYTGPLSH